MVIEPQSVRAIIVTLKWRNVFFYYYLLSGWRRRTRVIWHYWKFHFSVGSRVIHGVHQFIREWCVKLRFTSKLSGNTNPAHKDAFNSLIADLKNRKIRIGFNSLCTQPILRYTSIKHTYAGKQPPPLLPTALRPHTTPHSGFDTPPQPRYVQYVIIKRENQVCASL